MTVTEQHVEAVQRAASKFLLRVPSHADREAIRGAALEALAKAAASHDGRGDFVSRAVQLSWFAMIDEARRQSPLTRGHYLAVKRGDTPTYHGREALKPWYESLDEVVGEDGRVRGDVLPDGRDGFADVDVADERRRKLASLNARARFILLAVGYGYALQEIADLLGITESRVSQIASHSREKVAA